MRENGIKTLKWEKQYCNYSKQWDLSFRWKWDGNGNKMIEMGGI